MTAEEAFSSGIVAGLKPYATKENKEKIEKVTTPEEFKKLYKEDKSSKIKSKLIKEKKTKTFLKRPSVSAPSYSTSKLIKQMSRGDESLVREVESREITEDRRSLFFKEEFKSDSNKHNSWLSN